MNPLKGRSLAAWKLVPVIAACSIFAACDDGPTAPRIRAVPTSVPARATPTPVPIPNVAGSWSGTFTPGTLSGFCGTKAPASATFGQEGSRVTGTVLTQSPALAAGRFEGELQGLHLSGTLQSGVTTRAVTGSASATVLAMKFPGCCWFCGTSSIVLTR